MKKIFLAVLFVCLFAGISFAQTWHTADSVTIAWDAVTVPSGTVTYKTYIQPYPSGVATNVGEVSTTNAVITFQNEGRYILGVSTVRVIDKEVLESEIAWSNVVESCLNGDTFAVKYFIKPNKPTGLVKQ